jgi:hypothetical protein
MLQTTPVCAQPLSESDQPLRETVFSSRLGWMVLRRRAGRVIRLAFGYPTPDAAQAALAGQQQRVQRDRGSID